MINFIDDYLKAQGRNGDNEVRNVSGELSHVNTKEANLIDNYGPLGELMTRNIGSGGINPQTGMREYQEDDTSPWGEFKDMSPTDFVNMDDESKLTLAQDLGYSGLTSDDFDKYMPTYDEEGEQRILEESADRQAYMYGEGGIAAGRIGEVGQGQLSTQMEQAQNMKSRRNFEQTGNPMIDKQRQDLMQGIQQGTGDVWRKLTHDLHTDKTAVENQIRGDQENYMQRFGERIISYEDKIDAGKEGPGGPNPTAAWDETLGKHGLGGFVGSTVGGFWDETVGVGGLAGGLSDTWDWMTGKGERPGKDWTLQNNPVADVWDASIGKVGKSIGKGIKKVFDWFSDEQIKKHVNFEHMHGNMPVYSYNYIWEDKGTPRHYGYMAQDVEKIHPDAVSESQGFKRVDYGKIIKRANEISSTTKNLRG
jgi:hypothetical protein